MNNGVLFNDQIVINMFKTLVNRYNDLMDVLYYGFQKNFLEEMSHSWASGHAVRFFNNDFKTDIDGLVLGINYSFQEVFYTINFWAVQCAIRDNVPYTPQSFSPIFRPIDASMIRKDIGGFSGIDFNDAQALVDKLAFVVDSAEICLRDIEQYSAGLFFIDDTTIIRQYFINMRANINNSVSNVVTKIRNEFQQTLVQYEDTSGRIKAKFEELINNGG